MNEDESDEQKIKRKGRRIYSINTMMNNKCCHPEPLRFKAVRF